MPIEVNDGLQINAPRYGDTRAGKISSGRSAPYSSLAEALSSISKDYRSSGMKFLVREGGIVRTYRFTDSFLTDGVVVDSGNVYVSTTPPSNPPEGTIWIDIS